MNRVVVLGRGGAGKSALAARLGVLTGLPVIELDKHFWSSDLTPLPMDQWKALQRDLISAKLWILDGDLGPYDAPEVRLNSADTVVVLDFALWRCAWRAARRSREQLRLLALVDLLPPSQCSRRDGSDSRPCPVTPKSTCCANRATSESS